MIHLISSVLIDNFNANYQKIFPILNEKIET